MVVYNLVYVVPFERGFTFLFIVMYESGGWSKTTTWEKKKDRKKIMIIL